MARSDPVDSAAALLLAGRVALSFGVRLVVGWLSATPNYFPDEYLYSELGRSLVESGRPLVRGVELRSPALLQPLLAYPSWLVVPELVPGACWRPVAALGGEAA